VGLLSQQRSVISHISTGQALNETDMTSTGVILSEEIPGRCGSSQTVQQA
jgi:hypothetical protein